MKIGITGAEGFIGSYLRLQLAAIGDEVFNCPRTAWENPAALAEWVRGLDAIVHLAGLSRHADGDYLYRVNIDLTQKLIAALNAVNSRAHVYLGSTAHEAKAFPYHASKRESRRLLELWANATGNLATTLLMANTFGPGGKPFFNSVIPTFCCLAARGETPAKIDENAELALIYVGDLVREIAALVHHAPTAGGAVAFDAHVRPKLGDVWRTLQSFRALPAGKLPPDCDAFTAELWQTYSAFLP